PFLNRAAKITFAPAADASVTIGRDVGRNDLAERRFQYRAAGKGLAAWRGMAAFAISQNSLIAARRGRRISRPRACGGGGHCQERQYPLPHAGTSAPGCFR